MGWVIRSQDLPMISIVILVRRLTHIFPKQGGYLVLVLHTGLGFLPFRTLFYRGGLPLFHAPPSRAVYSIYPDSWVLFGGPRRRGGYAGFLGLLWELFSLAYYAV